MTTNQLVVVTYNIDQREYNLVERMNTFVALIKETMPDVLLIQEATRLSLEKLVRSLALLGYKKFIPENKNLRPTTEAIFSKIPMKECEFLDFKGSISGLSCATLDIWGTEPILICTSQFGSHPTQKRNNVVDLAYFTKSEPNVIFGGDTNILEYQKDITKPEGWLDAWYEGGTDKEKYSVDFNTNPFVSPPNKDRPDRVWYKGNLICKECKFFGNTSDVTISSHFGILTVFEILPNL